jgi:hypothetical protein
MDTKPKPASYSPKRKRKPGKMNIDRRTRWLYRLWVKLIDKPKEGTKV